MIKDFFFLLVLLSVFSCKKNEADKHFKPYKISENVEIADVKEQGLSEIFYLRTGKDEYNFVRKELPIKKAVVLNASLIGYFTALGLEDKIAGVSSPEYIYSEKIQQKIQNGQIENVGNEQKYDVEKILKLQPDVIFTNKIATFGNTYELLKKNGIQVVFLDEYLEENPLEKSAYLKIFGHLFGVEKKTDTLYSSIKTEYDRVKKIAGSSNLKPDVLANEMYGNQWFMPGGNTQLGNFLNDAGGNYILKDNADKKAVPMSFEEVLAKAKMANIWVNAGNHRNKKELLAINPNYVLINAFKNGKIFALTAKEKGEANDFFESGTVRADLVLKDYVKILHPELLPDYQLTYMKELK